MKLSHNGEEWHGTFGLALKFIAEDLLSDGQPFEATLTMDEGKPITGKVCEVTRDGASLTVDVDQADGTGTTVYPEIDNILSIEIL